MLWVSGGRCEGKRANETVLHCGITNDGCLSCLPLELVVSFSRWGVGGPQFLDTCGVEKRRLCGVEIIGRIDKWRAGSSS